MPPTTSPAPPPFPPRTQVSFLALDPTTQCPRSNRTVCMHLCMTIWLYLLQAPEPANTQRRTPP
jgi:hypothetical protein